ncbi:hypothetical protein CSV86_013785 [Pseudomonas putida CSV86]|uniref:DUF6708 domain-containing protein n=1 Tax=Pseudomonas bharatica CSV86 TaxID=1005395 RepID=A0A7K4EEW3_9PSED|nr:DUF6708 domain-containing protein [Pseudomonas bharatica]NNJ16212.1 hypothetical protein [Pseudomonas bharatica CSV86]
MYFLERGFEWSKKQLSYEEATEEYKARIRQQGQAELHTPADVREPVSNNPSNNCSLYEHNDFYIDLRTPSDEKRGLITFFFLILGGMLAWAGMATIWFAVSDFMATDRGTSWEFYIFGLTFAPLTANIALYFFLKFSIKFFRLESLTARRIIVRFNRITRKVYLLRPKHLGGIRIMDWDKTEILIDKKMSELEGTGGFVILVWDKGDGVDLQGTPTDNIEVTFIGKPTRNASELLAFWEYIRRYMEDGPAAAPAPKKLICKFPWPWLSLKAAWGLDTSFFRQSELRVFVLLNLLLWPVILIHATGHWLSLLLCYEPRFPKVIEEAGR